MSDKCLKGCNIPIVEACTAPVKSAIKRSDLVAMKCPSGELGEEGVVAKKEMPSRYLNDFDRKPRNRSGYCRPINDCEGFDSARAASINTFQKLKATEAECCDEECCEDYEDDCDKCCGEG